nr:uncharacterized protein LOC125423671 isoform X11 [Ziziphus jujuba var. spinosa]
MAFARAYTAQLTMATALMLIVIQMLKATPLNMKEVHWEKVLVVKEYCSHSTSTYYLLHIQRFYIAPALGRMSYLESYGHGLGWKPSNQSCQSLDSWNLVGS